jgi:putative endonuclease
MTREPAVYILASKRNGTLYIGVTSNLISRVSEHKQNLLDGFTKRYSVHRLVYFELHDDMDAAIRREKQLKKWSRIKKIELIERSNPAWRDLYWEMSGLIGTAIPASAQPPSSSRECAEGASKRGDPA